MEFVNEIHGSSAVHLLHRSGPSPSFTSSLGCWNLVSSATPRSAEENFAFSEFWKEYNAFLSFRSFSVHEETCKS
jgi:hypothetical protein